LTNPIITTKRRATGDAKEALPGAAVVVVVFSASVVVMTVDSVESVVPVVSIDSFSSSYSSNPAA
jgi:hypothetical protein